MSAGSSWEVGASSWEDREYPDVCDVEDDDSEDDHEVSMEDASEYFFDYLVQLKMTGILNAKQVCSISHWAKLAGLQGKGAELALSPGVKGGNFSRKFDRVWGWMCS